MWDGYSDSVRVGGGLGTQEGKGSALVIKRFHNYITRELEQALSAGSRS